MSSTNWYDDHRNLAALARYMIDDGDADAEILYMLEKPWKFADEWSAVLTLDDVARIVDCAPRADTGGEQ